SGVRIAAWRDGSQVDRARMSWPDLACDSAAPVSSSLLPCEVMKSIATSTFPFSAHARTAFSVAALAPGTQWSQKPIDSLPAAWAPRTNGAPTIADARTVPAITRRREIFLETMPPTPCYRPSNGALPDRLGRDSLQTQ